MNHKLENNLLSKPNALIQHYLGIPDFQTTVKSYGKILYSNSILPYDSDSIYFVDKLHITFTLPNKIENPVSVVYYRREDYVVDDCLILKPNYGNGNNYHYSFIIEYDGIHFGYLHLKNTKKIDICKIEVDNRILYEKPIIYVLSRLLHIAEFFRMKFNNISVIEIARDTLTPVYEGLSRIYYQSTKCNRMVHQLSGKAPLYKPITKVSFHDIPDDNTNVGTFTIGAKKSESNMKVYCKTPEIAANDFKKNYITELHLKHFGTSQNINRVEASIYANAFGKTGIMNQFGGNIIEVLNPCNYPKMFFIALGDKLTFTILSTKTWDEANNDKYEKVRLIPQPETLDIKQKRLVLTPNVARFEHSNNMNKYKFKLVEYLDGDISLAELKRYFKTKKNKSELNLDLLIKAYATVKRNYNCPLGDLKQSDIQTLIRTLEGVGITARIKATFSTILRKILLK